eukprot:1291620-Pyramimonas_sp.AAC.4
MQAHYGPDYHTLGRGLSGSRIGFEEFFDEPPPTFQPYMVTQSFPRRHTHAGAYDSRLPLIQERQSVAKATQLTKVSGCQSRIYNEMPPRSGHASLTIPTPKGYSMQMTHEKKPMLSYRKMISMRRARLL